MSVCVCVFVVVCVFIKGSGGEEYCANAPDEKKHHHTRANDVSN